MSNLSKVYLSIASSALIFLGACSHSGPKADIAGNANPQEEITRFEQDMVTASANHADVLAPDDFSKAQKYLKEAKSDKKTAAKLEDVAYGRASLNRANNKAGANKQQIAQVLQARAAAIAAGAQRYPVESKTLEKLDKEIKSNSDDLAKELSADDQARLQREYLGLEVRSIQTTELNATRMRLAAARDGGAEKRAPNTLKTADVDLRNAENLVAQNAHSPAMYSAAVTQANKSSQFLVDVVNTANKNGKKTTEAVAIQLVQQNQKIGNLQSNLGATQNSLGVAENNLDSMGKTVSAQGQLLGFQQAIESSRQKFSKKEAEVYQQGDKLVIRLKTMQFPTGTANLPKASLDILAKVNEVVSTLPTSQIVVEGHTDSVGTAETNEKLSQARAESVAKYLETNGQSDKRIEAIGYGFKKPIASNKDKLGRAQNRRVDIVLTAATPQDAKPAQQ